MLLEHERNYGLGMDALVIACSWEVWFGHACFGRMILGHEQKYGLGMDALVSACSWDTKGIMVCAWVLWLAYALGTQMEYGLGMDDLVSICSFFLVRVGATLNSGVSRQ